MEPVLVAVSYTDHDAPALFTESLRRTGFGVLRDHPVPFALIEEIMREWLAFFESDTKLAYLVQGTGRDGFFSETIAETAKGHVRRDLKEYFHIYEWGRYPAEASDAARRYFRLAGSLAAELLEWVERHTPQDVRARFSIPLSQMIANSPDTLLRILRYPPLPDEDDTAMRAAAHEDINLLTVLPASNERGLQLLDADDRWIDIPCDPGSLIINVGDMLQEASGGYYRSTTHRVVNPTGPARLRSRISLPLFLHPRPDVVLSRRYTAGSYLEERLNELRRGGG